MGALVLGNFLNMAGLPRMLGGFVRGLDLSPFWILMIICGIYILLAWCWRACR